MNQKRLSLIPLIIISLMAAYSIFVIFTQPIEVNGEIYERGFSFRHYFGYGLIIICWIGFFLNQTFFLSLLTGTLLVGLLNLASFTASQIMWFSFEIGDEGLGTQIGINPLIFIIMIIHVIINYRILKGVVDGETEEDKRIIEPKEERRDPMIDMFKKQYENKSINELEEIIAKPQGYQKSAVTAAQELIEEINTASNKSYPSGSGMKNSEV